MGEDALCGFAADDFAEAVDAGAAKIGDAAEFAEEALGGFWADAGNFEERGGGLALGAALAMKCDGEAMGFVTDLLDQMKHGRVTIENNWFALLAEDVKNLFFFGDAGERLIDDLQ